MASAASANLASSSEAVLNNASPPNNNTVERRCENADCNVVNLVAMVPKRKTSQFVTEPNVMDKPMLIHGFTTVFQVDGNSAKLSDLKNANGRPSPGQKTIFRIVPNTHAHIVNYVVVDADGDSLRKINESDPATMRKLLESQKVSADQMLKKLMAGAPTATMTAPASAAIAAAAAIAAGGHSVAGPVSTNMINPAPTAAVSSTTTASLNLPKPAAAVAKPAVRVTTASQQTSSIQLPMRMHPNLKITAVASADSAGMLSVTPPLIGSTTTAASNVPLITPVPLASLQNAPTPAAPAPVIIPAAVSTSSIGDTVEKPVFDKMQAELQELRRTVAMLAEAQAKTNQQHQNARLAKRSR